MGPDEKSISTYDVPSDLRLNYNWDLPVGKGKEFFNVQGGWINQFIGNWKTSGNLEKRSGLPFSTIASTGNFAGFPDEGVAIRPNVVPGVNPILPNWKAGCDNPVTQECPYVNALAYYTPPTEPHVGDATRVEDAVRMPHVQTYNMAFLKEFPLHEQVKLAFRAELYGALNHVTFSTNQNNFTLLHDNEGLPKVFSGFVDHADVGMIQSRGSARFPLQPFRSMARSRPLPGWHPIFRVCRPGDTIEGDMAPAKGS